MIKKKVRDEKLLVIIQKIIQSSYDRLNNKKLTDLLQREKAQVTLKRKTGIPIGNLTSQLFANIYLDKYDQFVKHFLSKELKKQRRNSFASHYYIRYMDDFLFLDLDRKNLHWIKIRIEDFLKTKLKLKLHSKKVNIFPLKNGIDFLGYRIFYSGPIKLRKSTVFRFIKRMKKYQRKNRKLETVWQSFQSWKGYAKHGNSYQLRQSLRKRYKIFNKLEEKQNQNKNNTYAKINSLP
jgi:RNA-directed DNA polymerase